jgi:hypothetical protein
MRRRLFEGDHPQVAISLNNLAGVLEALGSAREARTFIEQALGMAVRLVGNDHPTSNAFRTRRDRMCGT